MGKIIENLEEGQQNKLVFNEKSECKVVKLWPTKKNSNQSQAILQVDVNTYNTLMSGGDGKLFVGYDYCDVYDSVELRRCFKCSGFNHHSNRCTSQKYSCPRCSEEHPVKDCRSEVLKCINCIKFNEKNKELKLNVNHAAWDSRCHVYGHKVTEFKTQMYAA